MRQRLLAAWLATMGAAVLTAITAWTQALAICAIYTPDNVEWYLFLCYLR